MANRNSFTRDAAGLTTLTRIYREVSVDLALFTKLSHEELLSLILEFDEFSSAGKLISEYAEPAAEDFAGRVIRGERFLSVARVLRKYIADGLITVNDGELMYSDAAKLAIDQSKANYAMAVARNAEADAAISALGIF